MDNLFYQTTHFYVGDWKIAYIKKLSSLANLNTGMSLRKNGTWSLISSNNLIARTYLNNVIGASLDTNPKKFWSYVRTSKSESSGVLGFHVTS